MSMIKNEYQLKKVAAKDSRACTVCFRNTDAVLMSVDAKDWFYVCEVHLKDRGFAEEVHAEGWNEVNEALKKAKIGVGEKKGWKEGWKIEVKVDAEEVKRLESELKGFKVWFVLDNVFYRNRVAKLIKKKEDALVKEKLLSGTLLPTTNSLKKL